MPDWLPVYPRGHVQEALGADTPGCHVRALSFRSAVAPQDVIDFYAAIAGKAGFDKLVTSIDAAYYDAYGALDGRGRE